MRRKEDLPVGKIFPISSGKGGERWESQCQIRGCERTGKREIGKRNTTGSSVSLDDWWVVCLDHLELAYVSRHEKLASLMEPTRKRRRLKEVEFK